MIAVNGNTIRCYECNFCDTVSAKTSKIDCDDGCALLKENRVTSFPSPQGSIHGQPQVGSPSTPGPGGSGRVGGVGGIRRNRAGWRESRRADPTLINSLWKSKMGNGIRKQLASTNYALS
ncbi:hypothetical protein CBL_09468 [Carabus blaptoides fortunei]